MIRLENIVKTYQMGEEIVHALQGVSLHVPAGDMIAVIGPSGSGKSTLMNMIGCLDVPDEGQYLLDGQAVDCLDEDELAQVRNRKIGFIFQQFNLLPKLTAFENVELPLIYRGMPPRERREKAEAALHRVGLSDRLKHKPTQLSGGQQQRVAVARALAGDPPIILADEPTGALDSKSGEVFMQALRELNESGITIVLITHDMHIAQQARHFVSIRDGLIVDRGVN
ncbi:MAG TPA: ABC transporter ATP-binding protein [Syntrophomonas sp.]|nr:ABC transporter ATP-binding protein [Syntrophomonas sp.]